jgi:hypothetical protein
MLPVHQMIYCLFCFKWIFLEVLVEFGPFVITLILNVSELLLVLLFITLFVLYMCINEGTLQISYLSNCRIHFQKRHHIFS